MVARNDSIDDGTMSILRWTSFFYQLLNPSISFDHFFYFVIVLLGIKVDNLRRDYYWLETATNSAVSTIVWHYTDPNARLLYIPA